MISDVLINHFKETHGSALVIGVEKENKISSILPNFKILTKDPSDIPNDSFDLFRSMVKIDLVRVASCDDEKGQKTAFDVYQHILTEGGILILDNHKSTTPTFFGKHKVLGKFYGSLVIEKETEERDIRFVITIDTTSGFDSKFTERFVRRAFKYISHQVYENYVVLLMLGKNDIKYDDVIDPQKVIVFREKKLDRGFSLEKSTSNIHLKVDHVHDYWHPFHLRNLASVYHTSPEKMVAKTLVKFMYHPPRVGIVAECSSSFAVKMGGVEEINQDNVFEVLKSVEGKEMGTPIEFVTSVTCMFYDDPNIIGFHAVDEQISNMILKSSSVDIVGRITKTMQGNTFHHHYHMLYDLRTILGNDRKAVYVEIGVFNGGSLSLMMSHPYETDLYGVDNFIFKGQKERVEQNISKFNEHKHMVSLIVGSSQDETTKFKTGLKSDSVDILFIDGAHDKNRAARDFLLWSPLVKKGGFIVFDDYTDFKGIPVKPAVDLLENYHNAFRNYECIGSYPNFLNVYSSYFIPMSNEYILKRIA